MDVQHHIVSGIYTSRAEAETVRGQLSDRGLACEQTSIVETEGDASNRKMVRSDEALKDVLIDGSVGAAVGIGFGALAEIALVAANVTLFVSSPLIAPLAMLGWGAALGGFVGAAVGASEGVEKKDGKFSDLILDAIRGGHVVLLAHTRSVAEATLARDVIGDSLISRSSPMAS